MESKAAEGTQKVAPEAVAAKTAGEEAATASMESVPSQASTNDAPAAEGPWESIKSKFRAASEYAALRARQGISMFKGESAKDESQSQQQ
ncbi:hypothetical protein ACP70R_017098 [Stipagrostis hirtigluma subsp. patula]